jgi:hypothetical protein
MVARVAVMLSHLSSSLNMALEAPSLYPDMVRIVVAAQGGN